MPSKNSSSVIAAGAAIAALAAALLGAAPASADFPSVFEGDVTCAAQPANGDVRLCGGPTTTWDGQTKIDVNVILPPAPGSGADGPYPLIGDFHGWGGSKLGIGDQTQGWAEGGYAVFSMSDRGWGESCGSSDPDRSTAACEHGYNHLMDDRVEVRDAQYLISVLADEGVAEPKRIGATGYSYGGGLSMALATLRDRTMMPDGSLQPWTSPEGTAMEVAAAVPQWPWSDLAYSLLPNGRTLDYVADAPYLGAEGDAPVGIEKASYVSGLYGLGATLSNYAAPASDPDADLTTWYGLINAGEPYESNPMTEDVVDEVTTHHSSYYIDHGREPAPLLIQSGWNDDLFPVDEALRFYNRTRTQYPGDPISLFLMDDGHARSQNKAEDEEAFREREDAWFDFYLKGEGTAPESSVEALTTKCGGPSEGPYAAADWRDLAPGEIRFDSAPTQTVQPAAGDPSIGAAFDPIGGPGACATASSADQAGAATYRLAPAPEAGFTLAGSATIVADLSAPGGESELAARLLDVAPDETETLVARGLLRPGEGEAGMVFQLHPQAYRFEEGHVAKLELLPSDAPYSRPSNLQQAIEVSNLELRLPVREEPGSLVGLVQTPAPKVLPAGYQLAADYLGEGGEGEEEEEEGGEEEEEEKEGEEEGPGPEGSPGGPPPGRPPGKHPGPQKTSPLINVGAGEAGLARGRIRAARRALLIRVRCAGTSACIGRIEARRAGHAIARGSYSVPPGHSKRVGIRLTRAGRHLVAKRRRADRSRTRFFRSRLVFADAGRSDPLRLKRPVHVGGH